MGAFVGRVSELRQIAKLFERGERLVTVWGVGGIGKTRAAREWIEHQTSPRWIVEVSEASGLEGLCAAVAARLDIPFTPAAREVDIVAQLGRSLRARGRAVVLIDNFDALVASSASALARWLEEAPALRILVTSRERLRLAEEVAIELLPLPLERADDAAACDAVTLLVTRVRELGGAPLDPSDPRIVRLASELEGIPLALELAAARLEMLGIDAVLSRLPNRLGLLARGVRGTRERQATMRGAIAWSWDLLSDSERRALSHFAIFRGGFTIDAAAHILGEEPIDVLGQLRDKSMLYARAVADGEPPRFSLYEVVREFGLERFGDQLADADEALRRHDAYFTSLASDLAEKVHVAGDVEALDLLTSELENLLEVHARALAIDKPLSPEERSGSVERAAALLIAADTAMVSRTPAHVRLKLWDETCRAVSETITSVGTRIAVQAGLGRAMLATGDRKASRRILEDARALATKSKLDAPLVGTLLDLGVTLHALGELKLARAAYEAGLARLRKPATKNGPRTRRRQEARAHGNLGAVFHDLRDFDLACEHYEHAITLAASVGDARIEGIMLGNLAVLAQEQGRHAAARNGLERAIHLLGRAKDRRLRAIACGNLGMLAMEVGSLEDAAIRLDDAHESLRLIGDRRSEGLAILRLGILSALGQDATSARARLEEARSIFARSDDLDGVGLVKLGEAFVGVGKPGYSTELAVEALADANHASGTEPSLIARSDDARTIARLLGKMLERLERGAPIEAEPARDALVVTRDLSMFRAPGAANWTRIDDHAASALILGHLVALRRKGSSKCASVFDLASAGWPNSKIHPSSAQNRVYVAIAWLRKEGLRGLLLRTPEGYLLDPDVRIERVSSPRPRD